MNRNVFADIEETHGYEEKLRQESMAMVTADPEFCRRLEMVQKAMALIFSYTIEHTSRSEDEATMQPGSRHHGDRIPARLFPHIPRTTCGVEAIGQEYAQEPVCPSENPDSAGRTG
jgi:hypothetical protein